MTSQNPTKANATTSITPENDDTRTPTEWPGADRELTDDEIVAVTGGAVVANNPGHSGGTPVDGMTPGGPSPGTPKNGFTSA